jgi:hypothetical protein
LAQASKQQREYWPEFDLLRGWAAVLMVINHVGLRVAPPQWVDHRVTGLTLPEAGPMAMVVWLGSFAPVVFFFVTGLGYGITADSAGKVKSNFGLGRKLAILFVADAMMWLGPGSLIGLDFFGFIALSMLVLAGVRKLPGSVVWASVGVVLITGLRFMAVPMLGRWLDAESMQVVDRLTGRWPMGTGVSFPPVPWLAFSLTGYVAGTLLHRRASWFREHRVPAAAGLLAVSLPFTASAVGLSMQGFGLFRWGSMSVSYYAASFALLAVLGALAAVAVGANGPVWSACVRWMSLRGVSAFAVVPLHFGLLACVIALGWGVAGADPATTQARPHLIAWGLIATLVLLSVALAHPFEAIASRLKRTTRPMVYWTIGGLLVLGAAMWLTQGLGSWHGHTVVGSAAQVLLCLMLVLPSPGKRQAPPTRTPAPEINPSQARL